jgi:hypothetical protein
MTRSASERMPRKTTLGIDGGGSGGGGGGSGGGLSGGAFHDVVGGGAGSTGSGHRRPARRESSILKHSAETYLHKCCSDLLGALSNFERKAEPTRAHSLADNFASARAAVLTLQARLRDPAGIAGGGGGAVGDGAARLFAAPDVGDHSDDAGTPPLSVPEFTIQEPPHFTSPMTESVVGEEVDGVFEPPPPLVLHVSTAGEATDAHGDHFEDKETAFDDDDPEVFV